MTIYLNTTLVRTHFDCVEGNSWHILTLEMLDGKYLQAFTMPFFCLSIIQKAIELISGITCWSICAISLVNFKGSENPIRAISIPTITSQASSLGTS
jgi:hypothetical protein